MDLIIPHANVVINTISFQEVPEEYKYCHKSLETNYDVRIENEDSEQYEIRKRVRYSNIFWDTHHMLENINEESQIMTYRK